MIAWIPAVAGTASDESVHCPARPRTRTRESAARSPGSMRRLRICWVVRGPSGWAVTPRTRTWREPASMTNRQCRRCSVSAQPGQHGDLGADRRPSRPVRIGPLPGDEVAVPAQHGTRGDQPVCPQARGQDVDQRGEDRTIGPGPGGAGDGCGAARLPRAAARAVRCPSTPLNGRAGPSSRRAGRRSGRADAETRVIIIPDDRQPPVSAGHGASTLLAPHRRQAGLRPISAGKIGISSDAARRGLTARLNGDRR